METIGEQHGSIQSNQPVKWVCLILKGMKLSCFTQAMLKAQKSFKSEIDVCQCRFVLLDLNNSKAVFNIGIGKNTNKKIKEILSRSICDLGLKIL